MSLLKVSNISENRLFLEDIETNNLLLGKLSESIEIKKENIELFSDTTIKIKNIEENQKDLIIKKGVIVMSGEVKVVIDGAQVDKTTYQELKIDSFNYSIANKELFITCSSFIDTDIISSYDCAISCFIKGLSSIELQSANKYGVFTKTAGYEDASSDKSKYDWIVNGLGVKIYSSEYMHPVYRRLKEVKIINHSTDFNKDYLYLKFDRPLDFDMTIVGQVITIDSAQNGNINGVIEYDNMGNDLVELRGVNAQLLFSCSEYISEEDDDYLLIYDRADKKISGTIYTISGSEYVSGDGTRFIEELRSGDYLIINNKKHIVDKIENNARLKLTSVSKESLSNQIMYKTSHENTNIECLINGTFKFDIKNSNPRALQNCINIISLRNDRTLYYAFKTKKKSGFIQTYSSDYFDIEDSSITLQNSIVHKLWINGELVNFSDYEVLDGRIRISSDIFQYNYFNNEYTYIIYDKTTSKGDFNNYAKISYNAFNTNYVTEEEYLESLYEFKFFEGFTENMSYTYEDFKNSYTQEKFGYITDRNNNISFQNVIGTYETIEEDEDSLSIVDSIRNILNNTENFRIIRYIKSLDRYVVYLNCKLRNPENETVGNDYDKVSYTIDFTYKMVMSNRLFAQEEWGTFSPFGLKLRSDIII